MAKERIEYLTITCPEHPKIADQTLEKSHALRVLARPNNGGWILKEEETTADATTARPAKRKGKSTETQESDPPGQEA